MTRFTQALAAAAVLTLAGMSAASAQMGGGQGGSAMPPATMAPGMMSPAMPGGMQEPRAPGVVRPMSGAPMMATPASPGMPPPQPFSDLKLPQQSVGNGAYNGGGLVLEYSPDGSLRMAR